MIVSLLLHVNVVESRTQGCFATAQSKIVKNQVCGYDYLIRRVWYFCDTVRFELIIWHCPSSRRGPTDTFIAMVLQGLLRGEKPLTIRTAPTRSPMLDNLMS